MHRLDALETQARTVLLDVHLPFKIARLRAGHFMFNAYAVCEEWDIEPGIRPMI